MLTTVEGVLKSGKVELTEVSAAPEGTRALVTFVPDNLFLPAKTPKVLYGAWEGKFPKDFDVDAALKEIRGEWLKEWEDEENG